MVSPDITESKQARVTPHEVAALSQQLTEYIREVFWLVSPDWQEVLYVSPAYEEIWGRSCESLYARPLDWLDSVVDVDREKIIVAINRKSTGDLADATFPEYRIRRPDGAERWIYARAFPICDAEGKVYRIAGISEDITIHKLASMALQASEHNLQQAQSIAHIGSWHYDLAGRLTWSDELYRIYGVSPQTFTPSVESLISLIHPDGQAAMQTWINACASGQQPGTLEFCCVWPDGTIRYIRGEGQLILDADGKPNYIAGTAQDITEHKAATEEIQYLAFYDSLTRLPNRRLLLDRLQQALISNMRSEREGALLFIDLDNFKALNDTLGHPFGDLLLQQVAQRLESCVRDVDTVSRIGGDEFVVMLKDLSDQPKEAAAQTEAIGEKILAALSQPYQLAAYEFHCTGSIGATLFNGRQLAKDDLMKQADLAMYQAKRAGRNTLRFYDPEMQASITARVSLERELRKALEMQQFQLHYQMQVDSSRHPIGAEVLIRWLHPERGLVHPLEFIPLAEETGLILSIGPWILETACAQIKLWQQDPLTRDLVLAVNVSAKQFHQAGFVAQVQAAVKRHAINPILLKLELTESLLLDNIEDVVATMNALNEFGVQFSLDDFGTGYSSLQYLKRLPFNQLKIDRSFVRDIAFDSSDKAIVRTIIAMAQSLNLDVIAEGVETEGQRQLLLDIGCTHFQGYLFCLPQPVEQFEELLKQG